ncbi:MAG: hypothetical protein ACXVC6_04550 [Bacteroidia bacterium]
MKKKETILVIEAERIVSMEIKMELELKGYSVVQTDSIDNAMGLKDQPVFKAVIIDIDNLSQSNLMNLKKHFDMAIIAIGSDLPDEKDPKGVKFVQTFLKPIDCKSIASLVDSNFTALKYN